MRFLPLKSVVLTAFAGMLLASCSDKIENFQTENIQDYTLTLEPGKYIIYRLDSLVFTNFGRTEEVHKYQLKDVVDAKITDNLGRPSYRIFRYLRDTAGTTSLVELLRTLPVMVTWEVAANESKVSVSKAARKR